MTFFCHKSTRVNIEQGLRRIDKYCLQSLSRTYPLHLHTGSGSSNLSSRLDNLPPFLKLFFSPECYIQLSYSLTSCPGVGILIAFQNGIYNRTKILPKNFLVNLPFSHNMSSMMLFFTRNV